MDNGYAVKQQQLYYPFSIMKNPLLEVESESNLNAET